MRATFFDGRIARAHAVDLSLDGDMLVLTGDGIDRRDVIGAVEIPDAPGSTPRMLRFPDGASCEVQNGDELMTLLGRQDAVSQRVSRWERSWKLALASLVIVAIAAAVVYEFGLPLLAESAAGKLPPSALNALSRQVQRVLDGAVFTPTKVPEDRQSRLRAAFDRLTLPDDVRTRLHINFRNAASLGANAMALPSGDIFVTDDLVAMTDDDRVVLAVIAHEAGHVDRRHGLRKIIQSSTVGILITWYVGDISAVAAAAPAAMLNAKYSRDLEHEADEYAVTLLRTNHMPPTLLADALELLEQTRGRSGATSRASYLSSHPATAERLQWIRAQPQ